MEMTVVREVLCTNLVLISDLVISLVFTSFGEEAQEIWLRSPDCFSPGGTCGGGNETSFLVGFTILCVTVNAKQLKSQAE